MIAYNWKVVQVRKKMFCLSVAFHEIIIKLINNKIIAFRCKKVQQYTCLQIITDDAYVKRATPLALLNLMIET